MELDGRAIVWECDVELFGGEACNASQGAAVGPAIEGTQGVEGFTAQVEQHAGEHLLVCDGDGLHPVRHNVVYVFNKNDVGALLVEVFYQGAVSSGAEDEASVVVAQGKVLFVDGYDVGVVMLLGKADFEGNAIGGLVVVAHGGEAASEGGAVFGRDGEVEVYGTVGAACVECAFGDVLFQGCACAVAVAVEFEQTFGQRAVAEVLLFEQEVDNGAVIAAVQVVLNVEVRGPHARFQVVVESEGMYVVDEFLYGWIFFGEVCGHAEVGGGEAVKVFEHACCCAGGRYEFEHFQTFAEGMAEASVVFYAVEVEGAYTAVCRGGGSVEAAFGEAVAEVVYLGLHVVGSNAKGGDLREVVVGGSKLHVAQLLC